jgi:DNA-binding MarR family transcriptional regulator
MTPKSTAKSVEAAGAPLPSSSLLPTLGRIYQELTTRTYLRWKLPGSACLALRYLHVRPDGAEPGVMADTARVPRQTMTSIVDNLEKRGLAKRRPHAHDRRRIIVVLSAKGRRLAQEIIDDFLAVETAALAGLKASQVDRLRGLLTGFADGLAELKQS